jgi:hypothetical protein
MAEHKQMTRIPVFPRAWAIFKTVGEASALPRTQMMMVFIASSFVDLHRTAPGTLWEQKAGVYPSSGGGNDAWRRGR